MIYIVVFFAVVSAVLAHYRGRNPLAWFGIGLFLNIFTPLLLFILPDLTAPPPNPVPEPTTEPSPQLPNPEVIDITPREWYYAVSDGKQVGPVSLVALRHLWRDGTLKLDSLVWCDGMKDWQTVQECNDLRKEFS